MSNLTSVSSPDRSFSAPTARNAWGVGYSDSLLSWDLHFMLAANGWRETLLTLLTLGGLGRSFSGVIIGMQRVNVRLKSRN